MALNNSNSPNNNNNNTSSNGATGGGASAATNAAATTNNNNNNCNNNNSADVSAVTAGASLVENLVVRIDENSDDNLQALFDSVLKPNHSKLPLQVPFRMRKLPNSFFNPPATGSKSPSVSHSRENSADSAFGSGTTTICSPTGGVNPVTSRLQISHSRAHSSPASLQQTYAGLTSQQQNNNPAVAAAVAAAAASAAVNSGATAGSVAQAQAGGSAVTATQQTTQQPIHMKQRSYDVVSAIQLREELGELPPGWEQARTPEGQIYYLK